MAGLYLHVPFCKQACHYCDFHFSTNQKLRLDVAKAMALEIGLRANELGAKELRSIYFGGGTPSLLHSDELGLIMDSIHKHFSVAPNAEITLEANPDDLNKATLERFRSFAINRLSIGIQSFRDQDLQLMNRAHNAEEASHCVELARNAGFQSISIDLIYGIPDLSQEEWGLNVQKALALNVEHLSSYCLTIEAKTAFAHFIESGKLNPPDDAEAANQYTLLCNRLREAGYHHYEVSNFCKPGMEAVHNSAYWEGEPYLGIGPSAHSYDGESRSWNLSNNVLYLKQINAGALPLERESLSPSARYNEYIMTSLRTARGINLDLIQERFGKDLALGNESRLSAWSDKGWIQILGKLVKPTEEGFLWSDYMASELFD